MDFDFRFSLAATLLVGTGMLLHFRQSPEVLPLRQPFAALPHQLGVWHGADVPISGEVLATLGAGDFLSRIYRDDSGPPVELFMAYFQSQSTGDTIHSPAHCLPGSGWFPLQSSRTLLSLPGHAPFLANRYLVVKGDEHALVLYWFWAHDRAIASEYWAKFYLVADAIRFNRSDGALIRAITPLGRNESANVAEQRLVAFARELGPLINTYAPR